MYAMSINGNVYNALNPGDPKIPSGSESQVRPDLGLGAFYRSEKYYVGLGVNHLIHSKFDFGAAPLRGPLQTHVNITAGYFYEASFDLKLTFPILIKTDLKQYAVEVGVIGTLKDQMWGGLTYRQTGDAILLLGYCLTKDKSLKMGYSMDYILKDQKAKAPTTHELMLSYQLPVNPGSGKKVVRTPRYRH